MTLIRPVMTSLQMTARADCAEPARRPLPSPIKSLAHWLSVGESQSLQMSASPLPTPTAASIQNKANFPFHQPCLFIGFLAVSSWTPLSITLLFRNTETNVLWSGQDGSSLAPCLSFDQSVLFFVYTLLTWLTFPLSHKSWSITAYPLLHNLHTWQPTFGPN